MQFTIKSGDFESAFSRVSAAATVSTKPDLCSFCLQIVKGAVRMIGLGADSYAQLDLPAEDVTGKGRVFFTPDILGLLKNRADVVISYETQISIKQVKGRYSATLDAQPEPQDFLALVAQFITPEGDSVDMPEKVLSAMRKGVAGTGIKSIFEEKALHSYIVGGKNKLQVASWDNHHFGTFEAALKSPPFKLAVSLNHFQLIERFASGRAISVNVQPNRLIVTGEGFVVTLPGSQTEDENYLMAQSFIGSLGDPRFTCSLNLPDLLRALGNLMTLHKSNTYVSFSASKAGLLVKFTGPSGTASEVISITNGKGKLDIELEPRLLSDTVSLVGSHKEAHFAVFDNVVTFTVGDDKSKFVMVCMLREKQ